MRALLLLLTFLVVPAQPSAAAQTAPEFNGSVYAIVQRGPVTYVGGSFTGVLSGGRTYPRERLAAFDTRTGSILSWAPTADRTVRALAVAGSSVYAGGDFGHVSGVRRDNIARFDAETGAVGAFRHAVSGAPYAMTAANGRLYVAGSFTAIDGSPRANLAAFTLATDALDGQWQPRADDSVHTVVAYESLIFLGGGFHSVGGERRTLRVAAVSATTGAVSPSFRPTAAAQVNGLTVDRSGVYGVTGGQGGRAIAWTFGGATRWQRVFDGDAVAVARIGDVTYVGGHFDRACLTAANGLHGTCTGDSVPRVKLAAIDAAGRLTAWAPQANGVIGVRALAAVTPAVLAAGGDFTAPRRRFALF